MPLIEVHLIEKVFNPEQKRQIIQKLTDAMVPGAMVEFDPEEAERAGAFVEDALSESDALESDIDLLEND